MSWFLKSTGTLAVLVMLSLKASASNVVTTIPENVLSAYAVGLGEVSATGRYSRAFEVPRCFTCTKPGPFGCESYRFPLCQTVPIDYDWQWRVSAPQFTIRPEGITFKANLIVTVGRHQYVTPLESPVRVEYDPTLLRINLKVEGGNVGLYFPLFGQPSRIATVNPTSFFSTHLLLGRATIPVHSRVMTGTVRYVNIRLLDQKLEVSNDIRIN